MSKTLKPKTTKNPPPAKIPHTILLLGSGALKIGEAGEFDYSGSQAIKALKEEGKRVILVNPNIATIQTSEHLADEVYFLPVTPEFVEKVIIKEKPDAILLSFGGQTALNCGLQLYKQGTLKKYGVEILGTPIQAVIDTEDRELFAARLAKIGLKTAKGKIVSSVEEGLSYAKELGYPVMLRTGFALGGTGSGVAKDKTILRQLLEKAFATSPQVILEESLKGWKEIEYEVVRDAADNCITVCNMENFDPVGIHTGESIVIAPSQTLNNLEYYTLRQIAIKAIREFKIVGECNIQYALNPETSDYRIIEVNARLSRSSALASKATGYPLAYVAAKLALGKTLPQLQNQITKKTSAFFEPALDYVVVKIPRWDLDKYTHVTPEIGSEMKSVGEVMSIGRTFEEALQKGARMLNLGYWGVIDPYVLSTVLKTAGSKSAAKKMLLERLEKPDPQRLYTICAALYFGATRVEIQRLTSIDAWFLAKLVAVVELYHQLEKTTKLSPELLLKTKQLGFSDAQIAKIFKTKEDAIRAKRLKANIKPVTKRIDTLAGEFPAQTNYLYMTYHGTHSDYVPHPKEKKAIVLGSGPYSIGTSVEFDWCAVNTVSTLRERGYKGIMINCNPETVSTDYDNSDYLYFEELSLERVLDIYDQEQAPFVVSVGGQVPNNLAPKLHAHHAPLLGTTADNIYRAEHRKSFSQLLDSLNIPQPLWVETFTFKQAVSMTRKIGYPVLVRPSFVLSGKGMSILESDYDLEKYLESLTIDIKEYPLVITKFLSNAVECDFDGVAQHGTIIVSALSEHIEGGGVHSGDSTLLQPAVNLSTEVTEKIHTYAAQIVKALKVNGPFNIQFLLADDLPYVIECNLRASRSMPFVSKVLRHNFIETATRVMLKEKLAPVKLKKPAYQAVKAPQFSFHKLRGADPILRVEMSSTGEVAAFGRDPSDAYLKAVMATGVEYPQHKAVLLSLGGAAGKLSFLRSCVRLSRLGYTFYSTSGTALFLKENGFETIVVGKLSDSHHPNVTDLLQQHNIDFAVVVPGKSEHEDPSELIKKRTEGYKMRRMAIDFGIPVFVNTSTASFFVEALHRYQDTLVEIKSWKEYRSLPKS